jgi:hypothetical protein
LECHIAWTPCGGDVVGSWKVMNCPLELSGQVDLRGFGLGCAYGETISGSLEVSGTWIADALGNVVDYTTTTGVQEFELPATCLQTEVFSCAPIARPLMIGLGYATAECVDDTETGGCICRGTFDQQGGLATISIGALQTGTYSVAGTTLTTTDGAYETAYGHCVTDDAMILTLAAPGVVGLVEGPIVLQKQ